MDHAVKAAHMRVKNNNNNNNNTTGGKSCSDDSVSVMFVCPATAFLETRGLLNNISDAVGLEFKTSSSGNFTLSQGKAMLVPSSSIKNRRKIGL